MESTFKTHEDFLINNFTKSIIDPISIRNNTILNKNLVNVKNALRFCISGIPMKS